MKNFIQTKWFTFATYILLVAATLLIGHILLQNNNSLKNVIWSFFEVAESRTFDYRQSLRVMHKQPTPNKDIVILAIDDASFEMLWDKYGEWPIPREVFGNMINYIEDDKPQAIIFDLMFIKSMKSAVSSDKVLIDAMNKYNNVYTSMNFDNQQSDVRIPVELPERISINVTQEKGSRVNLKKSSFINCRPILSELINGNVHIGFTNITRNSDGIIRTVSPLLEYQGKYYPFLAFDASSNYLTGKDVRDVTINKKSRMQVGHTTIPLTKEGEAILNWYGPSGTHTIYPMYKVVNEMEGKSFGKKLDFKDKIIIVGTTAMSLHDTKSVPIQESVYPGVEVHATFFNNMLDNNFIKDTGVVIDTIIMICVIAIVGIIVMLTTSTVLAIISTILFGTAYLFISYYAMEMFNLWFPIVIPSIAIIIAFALSFLAKYLRKSKDFEHQYKLATIDGLTELYNHRYFQDALRNQIEVSKRYEQTFSLIIIDIDYFKKFNDTYGHQAGDAVLKQVAQTLKKNSRTTDIVCRYGGEEMSIILPNTNSQDALYNANRIRQAIEERPFQLNATETGKVTISVGVATFPVHAENAQDLIEQADKGLYYAKEHGRNQVKCIKE